MRAITAMYLSFGLLFALIWLIWWMGICDAVTLEIAGHAVGNGTHILTVAGANLTCDSLNWTITN